MGEIEQERELSCCECDFCGTGIGIAPYLDTGALVYCQVCSEAYIILNRHPLLLLPQAKRQFETPWQDGFAFI